MYFFIDGLFTDESEAKLSILDLGILRGYGIFDYLRTYKGHPFHLKEHLERLLYSAKKTGLTLPYSLPEIETILFKLISLSGYEECSIKILVTGGISSDQMITSEKSSFIAFAYPLKPYPVTHYTNGIKTITTRLERPLPCSKTTQYLPAIVALKEGQQTGASEALYVNSKEEILEATTSNFFAFKQGVLITPPENGILLGITRAVILKLCENKFPIEIRPILYQEITEFDEAFVSASNKEVMPVVKIDTVSIGTGQVGPLTQEVMNLFAAYTASQEEMPLFISRYELSREEETILKR